jgi:hypothetical protein
MEHGKLLGFPDIILIRQANDFTLAKPDSLLEIFCRTEPGAFVFEDTDWKVGCSAEGAQ